MKKLKQMVLLAGVLVLLCVSQVNASEIEKAVITGFTANPANECLVGDSVVLSGTSNYSEKDNVLFNYLLYDGSSWTILSSGPKLNDYVWTPEKAGGVLLCFQIVENEVNTNEFISYNVTKSNGRIDSIETNKNNNKVQIIPHITSNDSSVLYTFQIYNLQTRQWQTLIQDSNEKTYNWTPQSTGDYWINVAIKLRDGRTDSKIIEYHIDNPSIQNFQCDKVSPEVVNTSIVLSGDVINPINEKLVYEYLVYDGNKWDILSRTDNLQVAYWTPTQANKYLLCLQIYNSAGKVLQQSFINYQIDDLYVDLGEIKIENKTDGGYSVSSNVKTNDTNIQYQWKYYNVAEKKWHVLRDWGKDNKIDWTPAKTGFYLLNVDGKLQNGKVKQKAICYEVKGIEIVQFSTNMESPQATNSLIKMSGSVKNPLKTPLIYRYLAYNGQQWKELSSSTQLTDFTWKSEIGQYLLCFQVIDTDGIQYNKFKNFSIDPYSTIINRIDVYSPDGREYYLQANLKTNDNNLTYTYKYYDVQTGKWWLLNSGKQSNAHWQPPKSGNYWLHVELACSDGTTVSQTIQQKIDGYPIQSFTLDQASPQKTNSTITLNGKCGNTLNENLTYRYLVYDGNVWSPLYSSNKLSSYAWQPHREGNYLVCFQIINEYQIVNQSLIAFNIRDQIDFVDRMSVFITYSTNDGNGTYNMKKALGVFNQRVIYPGQELSFNGTAGYCGQAAGYLPAGVVGGVGYGGGICQTSTTLYGAAIRAGLTIVERNCHSVASTYVPVGLDAMIDYGSSDLRIRNDYNFPVKIVTYSSDRYLFAEIHGNQPTWFDRIEAYSWPTGSHFAAAVRVYYKNGYEVGRQDLPSSYYVRPIA